MCLLGKPHLEIRKRHYVHRNDIKSKSDYLYASAVELGLDMKISNQMEQLMQSFHLSFVGIVQQAKPWTQT